MNGFRRGALPLVVALVAVPATATVRIEDKAKALGYAAEGCAYCHTFDIAHMKQRKGLSAGITSTDCQQCHPGGLPKTGAALFNGRGRWLREQKARRKASVVDPAWLKDYREPAERPGGRK